MRDVDLRDLSNDELADLFGEVIQEISNRVYEGDDRKVMYALANAFWESAAEEDSHG